MFGTKHLLPETEFAKQDRTSSWWRCGYVVAVSFWKSTEECVFVSNVLSCDAMGKPTVDGTKSRGGGCRRSWVPINLVES